MAKVNENLSLYETGKEVPKTAMREIKAGNIKGFTDINPMWRIKKLTEMFGACGVGWYYEITDRWLEATEGVKEISCFVQINLYINVNGEWSKPIVGVGGNKFINSFSSGLKMSDECYKMALTDALSVSCKALGIGASVYWDRDDQSKYDTVAPAKTPAKPTAKAEKSITKAGVEQLVKMCVEHNTDPKKLLDKFGIEKLEEMTVTQFTTALNLFNPPTDIELKKIDNLCKEVGSAKGRVLSYYARKYSIPLEDWNNMDRTVYEEAYAQLLKKKGKK